MLKDKATSLENGLAPPKRRSDVEWEDSSFPFKMERNINCKRKTVLMKMTSKKLAPWAVSALCLTLAGALRSSAQMDSSKASPDQPGQYGTTMNESSPAKYNRASGIVGMAVHNQNDEQLGRIRDVVFDLKSERVAYVVMAASGTGTLGMNEKLLAVPLAAFTSSPDNKYLILRADKAKVEAAAGIDRENWPSATNPSWGAEPFWQTDKTQPDNSDNGVKPGKQSVPSPKDESSPTQ
jgi:sporulation protein YlmC with PRC-barrel domain